MKKNQKSTSQRDKSKPSESKQSQTKTTSEEFIAKLKEPGQRLWESNWQFKDCPKEQLLDCYYYEYSRESARMKDLAKHYFKEIKTIDKIHKRLKGDVSRIPKGGAEVAYDPLVNLIMTKLRLQIIAVCPEFPGKPWLDIDPEERKKRRDLTSSSSSIFLLRDFIDLPSLVKKLRDRIGAVSVYLWDQLSVETQQVLSKDQDATSNQTELKMALAEDFNRIISGGSIYDKQRFKDVILRPEMEQLLLQTPQVVNVQCLNKMLLVDAYSQELSSNQEAMQTSRQPAFRELDIVKNQAALKLLLIKAESIPRNPEITVLSLLPRQRCLIEVDFDRPLADLRLDFDSWVENKKIAMEKRISSQFSVDDFIDLPSLVKKLRDRIGEVSVYLWDQLSDKTRGLLSNYHGKKSELKQLQIALVDDINRLIGGPLIYDKQRFKDVILRSETKQLLLQTPQVVNVQCLNKMLLVDAFPKEISKERLNRPNPYEKRGRHDNPADLLKKLGAYRILRATKFKPAKVVKFFSEIYTMPTSWYDARVFVKKHLKSNFQL